MFLFLSLTTTELPLGPGAIIGIVVGVIVSLACVINILVPLLICCCLGIRVVFATVGCCRATKAKNEGVDL